MRLAELIDGIEGVTLRGPGDVVIDDIRIDSREVRDGTLFVARTGWYDDGHRYIAAAIAAGAVAIACARPEAVPGDSALPVVVVEDENEFLARAAVRFFDDPTSDLHVIGVTGTNGKTSVAFMTSQLLDALNVPHALLSTVLYRVGDERLPAPNTTPDSLVIQRLARQAVEAGARVLVMEVSSHGIELRRVAGTRFSTVGFTNLSPEHLDFHKTLEAYRQTKRRLFTDYVSPESSLHETTAVVCVDGEEGAEIARLTTAVRTIRASARRDVDATVRVTADDESPRWILESDTAQLMTPTSLVGAHNRANLAVALGLARAAARCEWHDVFRHARAVTGAPGRLQLAFRPEDGEPEVFIDYAHTPDAVGTVLSAVRRARPDGRVVAVLGCGGDRDTQKRPAMARHAALLADFAVFTADNPRSEAVSQILDEMTESLDDASRYAVIPDRSEAIEEAVTRREADVVLLLGKGHETYQEINGHRYAFDDAEEARRVVAARRVGGRMSAQPLLSGWSVPRIAAAVGGEVRGDGEASVFAALKTDSRRIERGDVFVAIRGDRFDGHDFVPDAYAAGARLAIVDSDVEVPSSCAAIVVGDTQGALLALAAALLDERRRRRRPFAAIGITGSNGKTTVKELVATLLGAQSGERVLKTLGNFNNRIGMPMSVMPLADADRAAVLELGANRPGEIAELVGYARPDVAVLTSIGEAHTAGFGSVDGVRRAKREIFEGSTLKAAVIPAEEWDARPEFWLERSALSATDDAVVTFGLVAPGVDDAASEDADETGATVRAIRERVDGPVELRFSDDSPVLPGFRGVVEIGLPGRHQALNLAAALSAAGLAFGSGWSADAISGQDVTRWLRELELPGGRWEEREVAGRRVVDDAYNANPTSMRASIETVAEYGSEVWAVLGAMHELSDEHEAVVSAHREIGSFAASRLSRVLGVGVLGAAIAEGAGDRGVFCESNAEAVAYLLENAPADAVIFLKGSRAARLEQVAQKITRAWGAS